MNIVDEIKIIDPQKVILHRDSFNELKLTVDGNDEYADVKILRVFPISDPQHYICFKGVKKDEEEAEEPKEDDAPSHSGPRAQEIGIIRDIRELESNSRVIVEDELEKMYFIPQITRIIRIKSERGSYKWIVETNRGEREFEVRHQGDLRIIPTNRVILRDVDGNRYEIPNYSRLDKSSRAMLEKYM